MLPGARITRSTIRLAISTVIFVETPSTTISSKSPKVWFLSDRKQSSIFSSSFKGYFVTLAEGVYINPSRTLILSWEADGSLNAYIFTESQFNDFKPLGIPRGWEAFGTGKSGSISASIKNRDRYYAIIYNPYLFTSIKLYYGKAKLTWQETEIIHKTETRCITETRHRTDYAGLTVGLALSIFGAATLLSKIKVRSIG